MADTMRATVFHGVDDIRVEELPRPRPGPGEALVKIALTTICGTDVHILRGEYRLLTHAFALQDIRDAYTLFAGRKDGVPKVAVRPSPAQ
jgi:threonine dehydrogenase-like Zn-dependent dehydrogenase